jgi:transcription antitermination factor NusG
MFLDLIDPTLSQDVSPDAWYAIYTRPKHEKTVSEILTSKGFETFLPLYLSRHRWSDRTKVVSLPLFPSYVFLKGGLDRRLALLTTPGLHSLVSCAGQPAVICPDEMDALRRTAESGLRVEPHPFLKCGDRVRVKSGPLAGVEGILLRKKNLSRLVVSVEMLGKAASVEIDGFLVERINSSRSGIRSVERGAVTALRQLRSVTAG